MFLPCIAPTLMAAVWSLSEQSSKAGSASSVSVPTWFASGDETNSEELATTPVCGSTAVIPWVWPAMRLSAPGVEGPKVEL